MLRSIFWGLAFFVVPFRAVFSQEPEPNVSGTYVAEPVDSAHADSPFVGMTFSLSADTWSLGQGDRELVAGGYAVRGDTLRVWDEEGEPACPSSVVGRYLWTMADQALRFTLLEDDCDGRREFFTWSSFVSTSPGQ